MSKHKPLTFFLARAVYLPDYYVSVSCLFCCANRVNMFVVCGVLGEISADLQG
ncbi:MAG: hypothetical protein ACPG8W_07350 [Candidatus Promineifilaceae bacterium]